MRLRVPAALVLAALSVLVAGGGAWVALGALGRSSPPAPSAAHPVAGALAAEDQPSQPPIPRPRPKVVEPVAGQSAVAEPEVTFEADTGTDRRPTRPASAARVRGVRPTAGKDPVRDATALPSGVALPPLEAPEEVMRIIDAGNVIARSPYKWGGGHGKWQDTGYDCSGSVSYALAAAGLLAGPLASGPLMSWGVPGRGKWVTIFANDGHVYMEVAGLRFDTSGARVTGSRWQNDLRGGGGFTVRHPPGL